MNKIHLIIKINFKKIYEKILPSTKYEEDN